MTDLDSLIDAFAAAHVSLHEVAAEVAEVDRGLAGRLHVAKQATETALSDDEPDAAAARLRERHAVARESMVAVCEHPPACGDAEAS